MNMRWMAHLLIFALATQPVFAQVPPDDFLEEDDFAPPPPAFNPPNDIPAPPPDLMPPSGGGSTGTGSSEPNPTFGNSKTRKPKVPLSQARPEDLTNQNYPDLIESFDYPNAEIGDIVKAISELTGKNFIIDPAVKGRITIMAPSQVTVAEAYKAFLAALAINGFTVVPYGKFWKIKNSRLASKDNIDTYSGGYAPDSDQMITRIVHLKYISADEVNKSLRNLTSKDGDIQVYAPTNTLIISDYGSTIDKMMSILREIDKAGFEEQMELMPIRYAKARDIADMMDKIINKDKSKGAAARTGFTTGIPRFGAPAGQPSSNEAFSMVIPDDRTNSIVVVGNRAGIEKIRSLVRRLDRKIRAEDSGGVYVYYCRHANAKKLAETLNGLATDATKKQQQVQTGAAGAPIPAQTTEPVFGGETKFTANEETNSIIVTASKQDYQVVLNLLRKIDIPRDSVYVEVVIMEMTVGNGNNWSPTYYQFVPGTNGVGRIGFAGASPTQILDLTQDKGMVLGFGSGEKMKISIPGGGEREVTSTLGFINFLKTIATLNILSTPQILAMDNEEAEIVVGEKVPSSPTTTQTATGSATGINYEDAVIKLNIKPHLSKTDDKVRLELKQEVKQVANLVVAAKALADTALSFSRRDLKSNILVRDGDTAVLGGLMQDREVETVQKVPILGDIPILGWLFKSRNINRQKVNLLVFLTPRIIRNSSDSIRLLESKLNDRVDFIRKNMGGRDPFGTQMEPLHRKAEAEVIRLEEAVGNDEGIKR